MAQMDLSPVPDPRLQKPVLPLAQGAPATPDPQPVAPVSMPTATVPAMPEAGAQPAEKLNKVPLAFPQLGQQNETQNQQTLRQTQQRGSGISNIHNPVLRTAAQIGDILLGDFAPRAERLTPGTEGNYALHLARAGNAVAGEREGVKAQGEQNLQSAQALHSQAQARLANTQADVAEEESKKNTVVLGPGQGVYNLKTGSWDVEPSVIDKEKVTEVDPEFGKSMHLVPTKDGRYLVPNSALGEILKPKAVPEAEAPLGPDRVSQYNKQLTDRYAVLNKGAIPAEFQLPPNATMGDYNRVHQSLQQLEAAGQSNQAHQDAMTMARLNFNATQENRRNEDFIRSFDRLHTQFNAELTPVNQQLENIQEARRLVASGAVGQALGTVKSLVAVAGGRGSGVRVTQPELNSIPAARGLPGGFDTLINNIMGSGKLTGETQKQLDAVLGQVEEVATRKQSLVNGAMDRAAQAKTPEDLRKIETDYRHQVQASTQPTSGGHIIEINGKRMQYKGSGDTADVNNYTEVKSGR